jgi:hypothetical protein
MPGLFGVILDDTYVPRNSLVFPITEAAVPKV